MIEPIMYAGIGFLIAGLLVLGVIPLVHARAVRLTTKRVESMIPMSMAEIQADKDQLRAEFAMSTRRLEMNVEQMKAQTTNQLAEIAKKGEAINRLKLELSEKNCRARRSRREGKPVRSGTGQRCAATCGQDRGIRKKRSRARGHPERAINIDR